jgi:dipeptidyl aminopeptidase/acylaminoacyl peptidase
VDDPAAPPLHRVISSAFEEAKDVVAAFDFLQGCLFVDGQRIALGGHSMGGVVAVIAAAEIPVKALLLINAGYRRVERGGPDQGPGAVSEVWEKAVPRVSAPTLVLQAKSDGVVSSDSGQRLAKMLQARGVPVELKPYDGGHTTVPPLEIVMGFLKKHLLSGSAARAR